MQPWKNRGKEFGIPSEQKPLSLWRLVAPARQLMMNGESDIATPLCPSPKKCKVSKVARKSIRGAPVIMVDVRLRFGDATASSDGVTARQCPGPAWRSTTCERLSF